MNAIPIRRIFRILGRRGRGVLPRALAAVLVAALLASGLGRTASARADTAPCQGPCLTYPLLNLGGLFAANAAQTASLQNLEQQALTNTINDHQLPSSDAAAVLTWGQYDAEAELWGLIVQAIQTPAASRTADQQNAVNWLSGVQLQIKYDAAVDAGMEYAKFAGFDPGGFSSLAYGGADQNTLTNYLCAGSGDCSSGPQYLAFYPLGSGFNTTPPATGGYCVYQPPSPDQGSFSDSTEQTCYRGCTSILGCSPAVPSSDQFTQWGEDDENNALSSQYFDTPAFAQASRDIAVGASFGGAVVGAAVTGVALSTALSGVLVGSSLQTAIFPYLGLPLSQIVAPGALGAEATAELAGAVTASGVGFIAGVAIAAIAIAVNEGINVFNAANLPGVLAGNVVSARNNLTAPPPDLSAALTTTSGTQTLYSLFVAATSPVPGNTPPIPAPAPSDPMFALQRVGATTTTDASSISWEDGITQTVDRTARLSGDWFVEQVPAADGSTTSVQTLRIHYVDWYDQEQTAWLLDTPTNGYMFVRIADLSESGEPFNPSTCVSDGTCYESSYITYVGSDGNDYRASVVPYQAPTVTTTVGPNVVEGAPQSFSASLANAPLGQTATYQWQFEQPQPAPPLGDLLPCRDSSGAAMTCPGPNPYNPPEYSPPITASQLLHVWPTSGTFHVRLTAIDSFGRPQVQTFTVTVGDVPPTVALNQTGLVALGHASTLTGMITHASSADAEHVMVDWGDGATDDSGSVFVDYVLTPPGCVLIVNEPGANGCNLQPAWLYASPSLSLTNTSSTVFDLSDTHTYAAPGVYTATVSVQDQSGATVKSTATEIVTGGPQTISFAPIPDHTYGDAPVFIGATGGGSGKPVTFSTHPSGVCGISSLGIGTDTNGDASYTAMVALHAAGSCTVTAEQAGIRAPGGIAIYPDAAPVQQSFQVKPAPLTITANDKSMTYGGAVPASFFDAHYAGFVNGDSAASLSNPPQCQPAGPASSLPVGMHPITCGGAQDPNYSISYQPGTLAVNPAPLTVTANNQSMTYGGSVPAFTAHFQGLVNGDSGSVVTGLACGATDASGHPMPVSSTTPAGTYTIICKGPPNIHNYTVSYASGMLTINNPVPATSGLSPSAVQAGGAAVALTISGRGFVPGSTVQVLASGGATTLTPSSVSADGTQLTVTLPATLTAQASTVEVQVVNATPGGGTSNIQPLFVTTASTTVASLNVSSGGTASTGGSGANTPGSVTVSGSGGTGILAVALYSANPGAPPRFAASSAYFDAYVAPGSSYSSVQITNCDLSGGQVALWYDAATSSWVQASQQSYDATTGCTTITVNATTRPSLAQLDGTPFAIADDPLLSLDAQGLPGSVPQQATLDGQTVSLPDKVAVPYNSSHSYSVPALVIDGSSGTAYFTADQGFSGPITATITDTAVYQTMDQIISATQASGGIDNGGQANALTQQFAAVQADIAAGNTSQALSDVQSFAAHVQAQSGKHLTAATAQALLADAQLVYAHLGGTGQV